MYIRPFLLLFILLLCRLEADLPADISLIVLDIKYSDEHGVKVCEMQPGMICTYKGYDYLTKQNGGIPKLFCNYIAHFPNTIWSVLQSSSSTFHSPFSYAQADHKNWRIISTLKELHKSTNFLEQAKTTPKNLSDTTHYPALLLAFLKSEVASEFRSLYPGLLILNGPFYVFGRDKYEMSLLFQCNSTVNQIKPQFNKYPRKYTSELANQIIQDFNEHETLVIKPINGSLGRGVIIIDREHLDETLYYILRHSSKLRQDPDEAYNFWGSERASHFIVEAFYPSDHVRISHFNDQLFDPTMRVVLLMSSHLDQIGIDYLGIYGTVPKIPIDADGSLTEKHKSYGNGRGPYYLMIDTETEEKIKSELTATLPVLYKELLTKYGKLR